MEREFIVKNHNQVFELCEEAIDNVHQVLNVWTTHAHDYSERFKAHACSVFKEIKKQDIQCRSIPERLFKLEL